MANKLSATSDSEVAAAAAAATANRTVFIDTSLDTHLAMVLSDLDTVSDLKRKIEKEHTLCFTNIGNIVVHALKVKRKGHLYHLSDSMFVKDAFDGASRNWFLSVDASIVENKLDGKQLVLNPDSHNLSTCYGVLCNTSANGVDLLLEGSPKKGTSDLNKGKGVERVEYKTDSSMRDVPKKCKKAVEEASQSDHAAKRKRKFVNKVGNGDLNEESINIGKDISKGEIIPQHALGDTEKSENAALNGLTSKPVDNDHQVMDDSSSGKKKRRKKLKTMLNEVAAGDPSSGTDVLEERGMTTTGVDLKDSGGEPDAKSVRGKGENGTKHTNTIQETEEYVPSADIGREADAPEEEATSVATKMGNLRDHNPVEMESNPPLVMEKHDDLQMDTGVSGQENVGNGPAERSEEQGTLSKRKGSLKLHSKNHDDLPLDVGVSGQDNIRSGQAERAREQGTLSKRKGSVKMQSKKDDDSNLPLDIGVSGQENIGGGQAVRVEGQGALSNNEGSLITWSKKNVNVPMDIGVSGKENIASDQVQRAEDQRALSKKKDSLKTQPKKHDDLLMDTGVAGKVNVNSGQAEIAEKQGALTNGKNSLKMQLKKLDSRMPDKTDVKTKDPNATADLLDKNGTEDLKDSRKKRKRTKKAKDLVAPDVTSVGREDVEGSEANVSAKPHGVNHGEPLSNKVRNEESNLSQTNGKEELRSNAESIFMAKESGDVPGNEEKNMQQTREYQENAENVEEQVRRKPKKKQKSSVKNLPDFQSEDGSIVHQISAPPAGNKTQVVASHSKNKGKLRKAAVDDRLNEEGMLSNSVGIQMQAVAQSNSVLDKSSNVQSNSIGHKNKGNAGEVNPGDKAKKETEISGAGNKGNIEKPLPGIVLSSGALVDKKIGTNKADNTPKCKNFEKPDKHSDRISSDTQISLKSSKKQGMESKHPVGKSSNTPLQGSLSKDNPDESAVQPKKSPKASRNEAKDLPTTVSDKLNLTPKQTNMQNAVGVSGTNIPSKNAGLASISNSPMESSWNINSKDAARNKHQPGVDSNRAANAKPAYEGNGKITNSSEPRKKLIATPGTIFKDDDSGESSEDEDEKGLDNSDGSTRTPSDYSQSSDYSDGKSNATFKSPQKGSYTADRTKSGWRSTIKSCSSSTKNMTFDSILKSSSRYKKAKLTASQLQLEDESQPDEFVPDSLPIE